MVAEPCGRCETQRTQPSASRTERNEQGVGGSLQVGVTAQTTRRNDFFVQQQDIVRRTAHQSLPLRSEPEESITARQSNTNMEGYGRDRWEDQEALPATRAHLL